LECIEIRHLTTQNFFTSFASFSTGFFWRATPSRSSDVYLADMASPLQSRPHLAHPWQDSILACRIYPVLVQCIRGTGVNMGATDPASFESTCARNPHENVLCTGMHTPSETHFLIHVESGHQTTELKKLA
jgi:hypothetical protein